MSAEAAVDKSIGYQRTLQAKRLASLPSLVEVDSSFLNTTTSSTTTRPAAADDNLQQLQQQQQHTKEQQQQVQQQQVQQQRAMKQQRQLQQLESLIKSVGLEEQLLNELKNLKLDETAVFAEDVKRMEQRFVNCMSDQKKELQATATLMNEEYAALRAQAENELKRLEDVMLEKRNQVLGLNHCFFKEQKKPE
ncbi:hypothetical protein ACSSS7_004638 [Eimeria intestinalis]